MEVVQKLSDHINHIYVVRSEQLYYNNKIYAVWGGLRRTL